jgi:D-galacturonate reductase
MPVIGMGTSASPAVDLETTVSAILEAIQAGYRHFDTAFAYGSEKPLGIAIAKALKLGLIKSRHELFITTKLFACFTDRDQVVPAIKISLQNLELDYVDLFLVHWPLKLTEMMKGTPVPSEIIQPLDLESVWAGMEDCQKLGFSKAIGVSNFSPKKLEKILSFATIPPAVNQVEMNPMWQQKELREFCKANGIHIAAYSPLGASGTKWGDSRIIDCNLLQEIAKAKGKTTAQISLRWVYEQGVSLVTKSYNKDRMKENLEIFDFSLTEDESYKISQLPQRKGVLFQSVLGPHHLVLEIDAEI